MHENILGRNQEKKLLQELYDSNKSEFVAVYGRRRVGKTFLVKEFYENKIDFCFTGSYNEARNIQLHQFTHQLNQAFNTDYKTFTTWAGGFIALNDCLLALNKEKVLIFLDELPWMDTKKSNFLSAFSYFWNSWDSSKTKLKLFVCGSATSWMIDKLIGNKGGLYGRITRTIYLSPFSLAETEVYLRDYKQMVLNRIQILDIYMILGGIPYYLNMLDSKIPIAANIDSLFFKKDAPLKYEYNFLFRSLFKESEIYANIIKYLAKKPNGVTRQELIAQASLSDNGVLSEALNNLISCEFIHKYKALGNKEHDAVYRLIDNFSFFYLHFISNSNGQDENFWQNSQNSGEINSWKGYAFEIVCLLHLKQIKNALGISGVLSNAYAWRCKAFEDEHGNKWNGGQIDLLIDRKDNIIDNIEIKYANDEFIIDNTYEDKIRKRAELFKYKTKTKKAIHNVFITTYGLKKNIYSNIAQNEICLDDLFK